MGKKEKLPWFECHPTKLLDALSGMPPSQQLVYCIILFRMYDSADGALTDTAEALARRTHYKLPIVREAMDNLEKEGRLIKKPDGYYHNEVVDDVIEKRECVRRKHKSASEARWEKDKQNQQNGHANAYTLTPTPTGVSKKDSLDSELATSSQGQEERPSVRSEQDFLSSDQEVFIDAAEIAALQAECKNITNVRGRLGGIYRSGWVHGIAVKDRKRAMFDFIRRKDAEARKPQSLSSRSKPAYQWKPMRDW
jgi:hypothetical protein